MKLMVLWYFYIPPAILGPSRKGLNIGRCAARAVTLWVSSLCTVCVGGEAVWEVVEVHK